MGVPYEDYIDSHEKPFDSLRVSIITLTGTVVYDNTLNQAIEMEHNPVSGDKESFDDPLYNEILEFAMETGKISASLVQRKFRLGYNRAARIIDLLEERGMIGPQNGSKPREVLMGGSSEEEN